MSSLAQRELFSGAKFKEGIYTGERLAQGIAIRKESGYFEKYGVGRTITILLRGRISMRILRKRIVFIRIAIRKTAAASLFFIR